MRRPRSRLAIYALAVLPMLLAGYAGAAADGGSPAGSPAPAPVRLASGAALLEPAGAAAPGHPASGPFAGFVSALAFDPVNAQVYVAYLGASTVTAINGTTGVIAATIPVGRQPAALEVMAGTGEVYVANAGSGNVSVISPASDDVTATIAVGYGPAAIAEDPQNGQAFVACSGSRNVTIVDTATHAVVGSVYLVGGADALAYDEDNGMVYVGDYAGGDGVSVLNASNDSLAGTIPVHGNPWSLAVDPQTGEVYLPLNASGNKTAVVDGTTEQVSSEITVGEAPRPLAFDPVNGEVYVANLDSSNVSVVSGLTHRIVANVSVGSSPWAVAVDPVADLVFVANAGSDNLSIINGSTNRLLESLPTGANPAAVAFDPASDTVFVSNYGSSNVSRFSLRGLGASSTVTLTESGIPASLLSRDGWSATIGGVEERSDAPTLVFDRIPDGTTWQLVTGPAGFVVSNPSERLSVAGALAESLAFSKGRTVMLRWHASGLGRSPPQRWCVEVDLLVRCATSGPSSYRNLTPGAYAYDVLSPTHGLLVTAKIGGGALPPLGTLDLARSERVALEFRYPYVVTFSESGLGSAPWTVRVDGTSESNATGGPLAFELSNGSYRFRVAPVTGYAASASPRTVRVAGADVAVSVAFHRRAGSGSPDLLAFGPASAVLAVGGARLGPRRAGTAHGASARPVRAGRPPGVRPSVSTVPRR